MNPLEEKNVEFLNSSITKLKGIGPKKAEKFEKIGIKTILDLLYYLPRTYEDRSVIKAVSECENGEICCIKLIPSRQIVEKRLRSKLSLFLLYGTDGKTNITVKWFSAPFSKPKVKLHTAYIVYGKMSVEKNGRTFEMRYIEPADDTKYTGKVVPVYHATSGLASKTIWDTINLAYENSPVLPECLPDEILEKYGLCDINSSLYGIHHPSSYDIREKFRRRLAFEELFILQLALFKLRTLRNDKTAVKIYTKDDILRFVSGLPFELTEGQKQAINHICADLKSGKPMNRLIQGDVGCGKTAVAAAVIYAVCKAGYQSAFMAPTEILANQHYKTLCSLFGDKLKVVLLTSSVKGKKQIADDIKSGNYDVIIGTHALLEDNIEFCNLALSITDEQHRFGVNQRATLNSKGENVHILVMSATPIPRTLSLILYGDVDVSTITTMPTGRKKVKTYHIKENKRKDAYDFVKNQVNSGKQCYVVCPLVEESENFDATSVSETYEKLVKSYLKGLNVSVIHGKLKASDKDTIMNDFKNGRIDVLVSTTVIEVGVDVPNATVVIIENAERFGLSQLHQLRGRVGRGGDESYCILISDCRSENSENRMKIMTETTDGFIISTKDLELRGSGEFFGTRQHGLPELKVANLFSDIDILKDAQNAANDVISGDDTLENAEWKYVKSRIDSLYNCLENDNIFN